MKIRNILCGLAAAAAVTVTGLSTSYAKEGGANGGGGDYTETLINDIRADIQKWITKGGAKSLKLPTNLTYEEYVTGMGAVLSPRAVVIGSISTAEEQKTFDPDLKVSVNGQPKTCRGSIWKRDGLAHILCNIERFTQTPENERYPLVHHEYAGLAGLERNVGASSDYAISSQLSGFLEKVEVLKLALKPTNVPRGDNGCYPAAGNVCVDHGGLFDGQEFDLKQNLTFSASGRDYFVGGQRMRSGLAKAHEGESYCSTFFSRDGYTGKPSIPKSLVQNDGSVFVPVSPWSPVVVTDSSWYTSDVHFALDVRGEKFAFGVICGRVQNHTLVESKATSLNEILEAFKGILVESK